MRNILVVIAIVALFALFAISTALAVYVAVFGFRADWFQVFVILVFGWSAFASWTALGMVAEWGTK
jgi:hypothetical protein